MNLQEIKVAFGLSQNSVAIMQNMIVKHGQFVHLKYSRPIQFKKKFAECNYGFKETTGTFRLGINYEKLSSTIEKREQGNEKKPLNGKFWAIFPHFLIGRDKVLARIYTVPNTESSTKFFFNGKEVSPEELEGFCLKSELSLSSHEHSFDLDVTSIKEIY